ncbi:ATP-binding protein [Chloroflexales bacterium ZM16-3]|nr:ATP-binding protein [Chloroflexales bacterium ZM16-3]
MDDLDSLFFPHPGVLIGREREIDAAIAALDAVPFRSRVLYFYGEGGVGKTSLLHTIQTIAGARSFRCTGVIDLQDVRYNQAIMLMRALRDRLIQAGIAEQRFIPFDEALQAYRNVIGADASAENEHAQRIERAFLGCYRAIAAEQPIMIAIDTFERIAITATEIERFNFRANRRLEQWLVYSLKQLPNTISIIAGRKRAVQLNLLSEVLGDKLIALEIGALTAEQSTAFVHKAAPELAAWGEVLHRASSGRPIVLLIAIACVRAGMLDPDELVAEQAGYPDNSARLTEALLKLIIDEIAIKRPEWAYLLTRALYLRKGLDIGLLRRLAAGESPEDLDRITQAYTSFGDLPITKWVGERVISLHDELYDLLFDKLGQLKDARTWYEATIAYLDEQIARPNQPGDRGDPYHMSLKQGIQTERLFYRMCIDTDPLAGYQDYREVAVSAIGSHAHDFDAMLRSELARFYDDHTDWGAYYRSQLMRSGLRWEQIVYEEQVRWVYRCISSHIEDGNRYVRALQTAAAIRADYGAIIDSDPLARCDLVVAELEVKLFHPDYANREDEVQLGYREIVAEMEKLLAVEAQAEQQGSLLATSRRKQISLLLGLAYTNWGYHSRNWLHLPTAIAHYKRALVYQHTLGAEIDLQRAQTLNNCGYALAIQGELDRGLAFVDGALRIYRRLEVLHSIGTSMNTRARILLQLDRAREALEEVGEARKIFVDVDSKRYLALTSQNEGNIRRRIAYSQRRDRARSEAEYEQAIMRYEEALALFAGLGSGEIIRKIEFIQSLGCAYRSRGFARFQRKEPWQDDMDQARRNFQRALDLCPPEKYTEWLIVPALFEDIGVTYANEENYAEAQRYLDLARAAVPEIYRIDNGIGLNDTLETREQKIYWLRLGQIELQYAICRFSEGNLASWGARLVRAYACLHAYSPQAPQLRVLRFLARRDMRALSDVNTLEEQRQEAYWSARRLNLTGEPFAAIDRLFKEVIEDIELGIPPDDLL